MVAIVTGVLGLAGACKPDHFAISQTSQLITVLHTQSLGTAHTLLMFPGAQRKTDTHG